VSGRDGSGAARGSNQPPPALGAAEAERLLALDRAARAAAQTRFDLPLVLEAGAGTGKTTTLIARLLAWCLGEGWERAARSAPAGAGGRPAATETQAAATAAATGNQAAATAATGGAQAVAIAAIAACVLRRVAALTFTEAAAAEMAERAARELLALGRGGAPPEWLAAARLPPAPELARRARALLAALDQLTVETIHAWCFRLLAAHPLEAEMHPRLQIDADGRLVRQVIAETMESALRPGYGAPGDPHLLALAAQGCGPREVAAALAALVDAGMTAAALRRDPFAGGAWPALRRRIAAAGARLRDLLAPRLAGSQLKNATGVLDGLDRLDGFDGLDGPDEPSGQLAQAPPVAGAPAAAEAPIASLAGASPMVADAAAPAASTGPVGYAAEIPALQRRCAAGLPANLRQHLREWSRGRLGGQERRRLGEVAGELAERAASLSRLLSHLDDLDPERLRHARLALAPLLAAVEGELRRRGIATFDALLSGARRLLATHAEVRARVRRGLDQLLVDEFQDTDDTQCEVLAWIALDGPAGERPGLFLVGDPKQSIYGWRSADLRAYEGFVARVVAAGGEVLPLVENFRSLPAVLEEVARVVGPVMRERPGAQPPFAPLVAARRGTSGSAVAGGRAAVEHWVSWPPAAAGGVETEAEPPARQAAAVAAIEAAAIAADLVELHDQEGLPWREAAILLRSTGDLDTYLEALRRAGIPFAVGRDKQYFRRREVIDAAALVRAVLDPGDHLALVTLLRSPAVGVPDAALLPLWRQQLPRLLTELHQPGGEPLAVVRRAVEAAAGDLPAAVPGIDRVAGWELSLLAAIEQLAVLREAFAAEPADRFVERLRRLPLLDTTAAARDLGAYRLANLDRFFRHLLLELEQGSGDVAAVLRALRDDVAGGREAEEGRPPEGAEDAVRVLTIHGAKGLDFAHVYLPQLHKPPGGERPATAVGRLPGAAAAPPVDPSAPAEPADAEHHEMRLLGAPSPGYDLVEERRLEVAAAERVRTLYVAMTRAKDRLVLIGAWPRRSAEPPPPPHARTHLDLLAWRPGCPDLQQLWKAGGLDTGGGLGLVGGTGRHGGLGPDGGMGLAGGAGGKSDPDPAGGLGPEDGTGRGSGVDPESGLDLDRGPDRHAGLGPHDGQGLAGGAGRNGGLASEGDLEREASIAWDLARRASLDRKAGRDQPGCLDPYGVVWRFPALAGPPPAAGAAGARGHDRADGAALTAPVEVAAQAARLGLLRTAAAARMARPFGAAASEEAHARLREEMAAGERSPVYSSDAGSARGAGAFAAAVAASVAGAANVRSAVAAAGAADAGAAGAGKGRGAEAAVAEASTKGATGAARAAAIERARIAGREAAMAAGAAVHRALELWDLDADPAREAARQEASLPAYLSAVATADVAADSLPRCRLLLARFESGGLADRLRRLAAGVLARELPVLLAPVAGPAGGAGPVAYVSGSVDLLYRDPESGGLVIADYKTDEVAGAELERRAATYASQGAAYVRAIHEALGLAAPPRFELWFLHAGEVMTVH
jgi:ATP-dependent exoDNAse (exonuclease V) beta subunit